MIFPLTETKKKAVEMLLNRRGI